MTNQEFCYWLQGYFEIAHVSSLTEHKLRLINGSLRKITEPLGVFTQWLKEVIELVASHQYANAMMSLFLPEIRYRLNLIFYHVIDQSYDREMSLEEAKKIHDGSLN